MLQRLRDNTKGVVAGILIGLLVIIFAISGAEALFMGGSSPSKVVTVNGDGISQLDIDRAVRMQRQQLQSMYGDSIPPEFLTDERLRGPAIDNLVRRMVLTQTARRSGMAVSDNTINQMIVSTPAFQQEAGAFDRMRFQQLLRMQGFTPSTYRTALAEEVLINQLVSGIVGSGFVTPTELERVIALNNQKRDFLYAVIDADEVRDKLEISAEEVEAYYNSNPQAFTQPEQVAVDYIDLNVIDLMDDIDIPEAQLRQQYEQDVASFLASVERNAAHILIESGDKAVIETIQARLAAGENFAELAREYSDDIGTRDQGGDLGYTAGDAFPAEFERALASLSVGQVSGPVRTDAGVHLIKLLDERGGEPPSFEEERGRIANLLKRVEAESHFVALLDRLRDQSYNAENLMVVAEDLGLPAGNTGLFPRSGGTGIAANSLVNAAAFSEEVLEYGNASDLLELGNDRVVVVKKTDYEPSYLRPLEEVREEILALVRDERARAAVAQQGNQLKVAVEAGEDLAAAAESMGLNVLTIEGAGRNDPAVNRDVLRHAFSIARPGDAPTVGGGHLPQGDFAVIKLLAVHEGRVDDEDLTQETMLQARMSRMLGEDEFNSFEAMVRAQAKVRR
jgi:peptidyl-prolyl cis-trans isomerase D